MSMPPRRLSAVLPDGQVVTRNTTHDYTHVIAVKFKGDTHWQAWKWTAQPGKMIETVRREIPRKNWLPPLESIEAVPVSPPTHDEETMSTRRKKPAHEQQKKLDTFTRAYIEAALWSETDAEGEQLDKNYGPGDIADETMQLIVEDAADFQRRFGELIQDDESPAIEKWGRWELAGHHFWLTRNGHGAGFWDGDWPKHGDELTRASKEYGEFYLYVGDDGEIHGHGSSSHPPAGEARRRSSPRRRPAPPPLERALRGTEIHTWFERDRAHVELRDRTSDQTIVEWWDEAVGEAVQDGFLDSSDWHGSAYQYALDHGLVKPAPTVYYDDAELRLDSGGVPVLWGDGEPLVQASARDLQRWPASTEKNIEDWRYRLYDFALDKGLVEGGF
jgi:hypothetical protein